MDQLSEISPLSLQLLLRQLLQETKCLAGKVAQIKKQSPLSEKIILRDLNSIHILSAKDVIYCKAERSYTRFFLQDSSELLISRNLKAYEQELASLNFLRVHHSYLVNLSHIRQIKKNNSIHITMSNDVSVPVSKRKRDTLLIYFENLVHKTLVNK